MSAQKRTSAPDLTFDFENDILPEEIAYLVRAEADPRDPAAQALFADSPSPGQQDDRKTLLDAKRKTLTGLAFSGGGIRSAAICTGVMQALARRNILKKFDYLSTVSGGGYAGTSLNWFLDPRNTNLDGIPFGVSKETFPFVESEDTAFQAAGMNNLPDVDGLRHLREADVRKSDTGSLIDFIRHRASYLQISRGLGALPLLAIVLRTAVTSLLIYLLFFAFLFYFGANLVLEPLGGFVAWCLGLFSQPPLALVTGLACGEAPNILPGDWSGLVATMTEDCETRLILSDWVWAAQGGLGLALAGLLYLVLASVSFSWSTYFSHRFIRRKFAERRSQESRLGVTVAAILGGCLIGGVLILLFRVNDGIARDAAEVAGATGTTAPGAIAGGAGGLLSLLIGTLGALGSRLLTIKDNEIVKANRTRVLIAVSALFLFFGLVISAIWLSSRADQLMDMAGGHELWLAPALALLSLVLFRFANLNHFGLHGMYSNRLMETFMPGAKTALTIESTGSSPRHFADVQTVDDPRAPETMLRGFRAGDGRTPGKPLQILNSNVVLASSRNQKHAGRGGDSFMLTPLAAGSKATGWTTSDLEISLPSAMAISGAAVNPRTMIDAKASRQDRLLGILMTLLNLRLGYWVRNPRYYSRIDITRNTSVRPMQDRLRRLIGMYCRQPNYVSPGLSHGLRSSNYHEKSAWLELTDGGHFDNIGLYELVRRGVRTIVAVDGSADPNADFNSFANAFELVRSDFGVDIRFSDPRWDFNGMMAGSSTIGTPISKRYNTAARGFAIGRITYPGDIDAGREPGWVFLIKSTLADGLRANLYSYRSAHASFPDEPTLDQFFDEQQFEVYRMLGEDLTKQMMEAIEDGFHPSLRPPPFD